MLLPIALNLRHRRCLVIGGGPVAARKVSSLLECEAQVAVISPQLGEALEASRANIEYSARPYQAGDCAGYTLIFACTDQADVNAAIAAEARSRGIWCNRADEPDDTDFHSMAAVRRSGITIGLSTSGGSPALTRHLRARIEEAIGPEYTALLDLLQSRRVALKEGGTSASHRAELWRAVVAEEVLELLRTGQAEAAEKRVDEILAHAQFSEPDSEFPHRIADETLPNQLR